LKEYFSFPDISFLKYVPQRVQHITIKDFVKSLNGKITFYGTELPETLKSQLILKNQINKLNIESGIVFFSFYQFTYNNYINFNLIKKILDNNLEIHFARERISITSKEGLQKKSEFLIAVFYSMNNIDKIFLKKLNDFSQIDD
tara:strand:- start:26 stop:457 length:432 start_codon:yes stop_codon:yes gene_type:complete